MHEGLKVYSNEEEMYVAESLDDCWKLFEETTGEKRDDYELEYWTEIPDDEVFSITYDPNDGFEDSDGSILGGTVRKTARQWAGLNGRGPLCGPD